MAAPSTPTSRLNRTTELLLVSPEAPQALQPSTGRRRRITPTQEELTPRKVALLTWPEPTTSAPSSLLSGAIKRHWPAAAVEAVIDAKVPFGPYEPNPLYSSPAPVPVRHIVLSFNLLDSPEKLYDWENRTFLFSIFPGTVVISMIEPFLMLGMQSLPPKPWPKTVAGLIPHFYVYPEGEPMLLPRGPAPIGLLSRSSRTIANELDGRDTQDWSAIFQAVQVDFEQQGIAITEVIYWGNCITIVLESRNVDKTKPPRRVGRLTCDYLFEDDMGRSSSPRARRPTDHAPGQPDESNYPTLQPGLRVASSHIPGDQQYTSTTTGVLVKDRDGKRFMTAAAQGFPAACGSNVYHPDPRSRVIGKLATRLDQTDIALVELKEQESFLNVTFKNADTPAPVQLGRLLPRNNLRRFDSMWIDSPDTGSIEGTLIATAMTRIPPDDGHALLPTQAWVNTTWSYMGQDADLPEGMCGSAMLRATDDGGLDVAGFFRYAPARGPFLGYCCGTAAEELIARGYTLAD
ncbi:hypothetical protein CONLIGDRAFT_700504 [Coniochaeta ligniaria NRRL 30616]|uniref:Uncharacterized protein n=1 Tax=Coniochaeta ligniaria NRRL 30616 TaxID=1408157 RepID=A0A1J7JNI8_9PEZI|nr:hypothetical protein CONLIGDRAFT_700504 [Coniochaeta ligniaria NRRL 30616]